MPHNCLIKMLLDRLMSVQAVQKWLCCTMMRCRRLSALHLCSAG